MKCSKNVNNEKCAPKIIFFNEKKIRKNLILFDNFYYSKALRCTFFGERKNSCSSKFVQLLLLNRTESKMIKKSCCSSFYYINSFSSNFFGPNSKTCSLRPCISRPYCRLNLKKRHRLNKLLY